MHERHPDLTFDCTVKVEHILKHRSIWGEFAEAGCLFVVSAFESMNDFRSWLEFCDASKIDSIWQSDRVVSREIALEPMTFLSVIAGATQRLKFGTNAIVLPFRDPITFARQCATLDHLSDGRFLPTVAIGTANAPEWEATGRSPKGKLRSSLR